MSKTQFRAALVLSYALALLSVVASFAGESGLPAPLREHLEHEWNEELTAADGLVLAVALPYLVVTFVSFIAMLKFWRWSRELTLLATAIGVVMIPLLGPTVEPGISTSLNFVSSMLYGAVIALAYYSPAAAWFQSQRAVNPPPLPADAEVIGSTSG